MDDSLPLTIAYFAILQEQAGKAEETITCEAKTTPAQLYDQLAAKYHFTLPFSRIRIANKETFLPADYQFQPHDYIALIPPVAGG